MSLIRLKYRRSCKPPLKPNVKTTGYKYFVYELQLILAYMASISNSICHSTYFQTRVESVRSNAKFVAIIQISTSIVHQAYGIFAAKGITRVRNQRFLIFSAQELDREMLGLDLVAELESR